MTDSDIPRLNDQPPRRLLSWGIFYEDEPRKGQHSVSITVWVPGELAQWELVHCRDSGRCRLTRLAAYLKEHLGFVVRTSSGWSGGGSALPEYVQDLAAVIVPVGAREVKAALAAR